MNLKSRTLIRSMALVLTSLVAGCSSTLAPTPGAETVQIINAPAPQSCQLKGAIISQDVNGNTQSYTSHEHLQLDEITTLKNRAFALGANAIVINDHQTTYIQHKNGSQRVNTHRLSGEAYLCGAATLNSLKGLTVNDISDASQTK